MKMTLRLSGSCSSSFPQCARVLPCTGAAAPTVTGLGVVLVRRRMRTIGHGRPWRPIPQVGTELALQCEAGGIAPDRIVLELVETASEHPEALLNFIHRARARGFQVAIDDFGVGDSNFERLWRIQPLIVKLDRSLLLNAESHRRARLLLESLVKMIRESGSLVLLEGIETPAQAQLALATDADLLQGFLFGQPGPVTEEGRAQAEQRLRETVARSQDWWQQNDRDQEGYLTLLRYEMMEAGHRVLCVDIHPDDLFDGHLTFPASL